MFHISISRLATLASATHIRLNAINVSTQQKLENESESCTYTERVKLFCEFMRERGAEYDNVEVCLDEITCRGLKAKCTIGANSTIMSVPMKLNAISAPLLLEHNNFLKKLRPPSLELVCRHLSAKSIHDPMLYEQVYLALLLAGERLNDQSRFNAYFDILPHPAINDAEVISQYKNIIDPLELVDWDGHQRQFVTVLRTLLRKWGTQAPPIELAYWALRTVLSRMHLLPLNAKSPAEYGSSLSYTEFATFAEAEAQTKWRTRLYTLLASTLGSPVIHRSDYSLVPTLIPLIDCVGHLSSSNVKVQVTSRPKKRFTSIANHNSDSDSDSERECCVELQSIRQIEKGEVLGMRFINTQSQAFTLYRFGFIPV